jgi:hypothetical protein
MSDYDEYPIYPVKKKKRSPQTDPLRWGIFALVLLMLPLLLARLVWVGYQAGDTEAALVGRWTGTLYQQPGGLEETYPFEMVIKNPDNGRVSITTTIWLDETRRYYATMGGFGVGATTTMRFYEVNTLNQSAPPDGIWCMKQGQLTLAKGILAGTWEGEANGQDCSPGRIELTRQEE